MIRPGMTLVEAIIQLTRGFRKFTGRNPDGLEKIKIKQEASQKLKDLEKVVDLEGNVLDPSKAIIGGKNVELTNKEKIDWLVKNVDPKAEQTIPPKATLEAMLKDGREDLIDHFFKMHTKNLPEDMADGGRIGLKEGNGKDDSMTGIAMAIEERMRKLRELMEQIEKVKKGVGIDPDPEDEQGGGGGRTGFKDGMTRRKFMKILGGLASIPIVGKILKPIKFGKTISKNPPPIKTPITKLEDTSTQMPEWFPSFVNKFRNEGKAENVFKQKKVEVSKAEYDKAIAEGKGENYFSDVARTPEYKAKRPDHMDYYKLVDTDERIYTTYTNDKVPGVKIDDMDGNIDVMFENEYSQPVSINYTAPGKKGPETGRADVFVEGGAEMETKTKGDFVANDVEVYATDPDGGSEAVDVIVGSLDDMLEGTTRQMEEYATGKKTKMSSGEFRVGQAEARAEQAAEEAAEAADDFASGGIARMLGE